MRVSKLFLAISIVGFSIATSARADGRDQWNARLGALGLLIGAFDVKLDYAANNQWTVGPELFSWKFKMSAESGTTQADADLSAFGLGVRANWFKNGTYQDGLYLGPSFNYFSFNATATDSLGASAEGSANGWVAACVVGYGWFWQNFNMMLGGGLSIPFSGGDVSVTDSTGQTTKYKTSKNGSLAVEYSLGWTF